MKLILLVVITAISIGGFAYASGTQESSKASGIEAKQDPNAPFFDISGLGRQVVPFTTQKVAQSLANSQIVIYFFAATWDTACQTIYRDFQSNFQSVPPGITIVFVNYAKAEDLKVKYKITKPDNFISIDSRGNQIRSLNDVDSVQEVLQFFRPPHTTM